MRRPAVLQRFGNGLVAINGVEPAVVTGANACAQSTTTTTGGGTAYAAD